MFRAARDRATGEERALPRGADRGTGEERAGGSGGPSPTWGVVSGYEPNG